MKFSNLIQEITSDETMENAKAFFNIVGEDLVDIIAEKFSHTKLETQHKPPFVNFKIKTSDYTFKFRYNEKAVNKKGGKEFETKITIYISNGQGNYLGDYSYKATQDNILNEKEQFLNFVKAKLKEFSFAIQDNGKQEIQQKLGDQLTQFSNKFLSNNETLVNSGMISDYWSNFVVVYDSFYVKNTNDTVRAHVQFAYDTESFLFSYVFRITYAYETLVAFKFKANSFDEFMNNYSTIDAKTKQLIG